MSVHRKILAIAIVLAASGTAAAQAPGEGVAPPAMMGWQHYPNERHLLVRALGGAGVRLNDAWGAGALSPPYLFAQAGYLFVNAGPFTMGPTFGGQFGLDLAHSGVQGTLQPGWFMLGRFSSLFALTARLDVPMLITRGRCDPIQLPNEVFVPGGRCYTLGFGIETGIGAALYLTAGVALTGEINFDLYFGDNFFTYPVLGGGLGVMVDYEVLP